MTDLIYRNGTDGIEPITKRVFRGVASDETVDEHRSIVLQDGLDTSRFERFPAVLDSHQFGEVPVAQATRVWKSLSFHPKRTLIEFRFGDHPRAETIYHAVLQGLVRGLSIGFRPLADRNPSATEAADGARIVISRSRLLEVSLTALPSNVGAVIEGQRTAITELARKAQMVGALSIASECRALLSSASRSQVSGFRPRKVASGLFRVSLPQHTKKPIPPPSPNPGPDFSPLFHRVKTGAIRRAR